MENNKKIWFRRKWYGWGWYPVIWQGWMVVILGVVIILLGMRIGEIDDAPGMVLFSALIVVGLMLFFGYWKGEKPRWQWGRPKEEKKDNSNLVK